MKPNIICVDPGVGGGIAWTNPKGEVYACALPPPPSKCKPQAWSEHQLVWINRIMYWANFQAPCDFHIERVHAQRHDTPKTAAALVANYHIWLCNAQHKHLKMQTHTPVAWQNQLGFLLPRGGGSTAYKARKKMLQAIATKWFPDMMQMSFDNQNKPKYKAWRPTGKTADALCMLWVYAGGE